MHSEWASLMPQFMSKLNSNDSYGLFVEIARRFAVFYRSRRRRWTQALVETVKLFGISIQGRPGDNLLSKILVSEHGEKLLQLLPTLLASFTRKLIKKYVTYTPFTLA